MLASPNAGPTPTFAASRPFHRIRCPHPIPSNHRLREATGSRLGRFRSSLPRKGALVARSQSTEHTSRARYNQTTLRKTMCMLVDFFSRVLSLLRTTCWLCACPGHPVSGTSRRSRSQGPTEHRQLQAEELRPLPSARRVRCRDHGRVPRPPPQVRTYLP